MVQDIEQESEHNIIKEDIVDTETMQHPFPWRLIKIRFFRRITFLNIFLFFINFFLFTFVFIILWLLLLFITYQIWLTWFKILNRSQSIIL
jgi:hypothetical protein